MIHVYGERAVGGVGRANMANMANTWPTPAAVRADDPDA